MAAVGPSEGLESANDVQGLELLRATSASDDEGLELERATSASDAEGLERVTSASVAASSSGLERVTSAAQGAAHFLRAENGHLQTLDSRLLGAVFQENTSLTSVHNIIFFTISQANVLQHLLVFRHLQALATALLPLEPHGVPIRQMDLLVVKVLQCLHGQVCVAPLVL